MDEEKIGVEKKMHSEKEKVESSWKKKNAREKKKLYRRGTHRAPRGRSKLLTKKLKEKGGGPKGHSSNWRAPK